MITLTWYQLAMFAILWAIFERLGRWIWAYAFYRYAMFQRKIAIAKLRAKELKRRRR